MPPSQNLIADDERLIRMALGKAVRSRDHKALEAGNVAVAGLDVLNEIKESKPKRLSTSTFHATNCASS